MATDHEPEPNQEVDHPPNHRNPPTPIRWVLPCHPPPPKASTLQFPGYITTGNVAPYDDFKPKILKEVDDFKGDSNNISQFFLKCELHFKLFNRHFRYPPHKVIFCVSRLADDTEKWWELCARIIGRTQDREQLYSTYEDFKSNLRERFWKDTDKQIKRAQWEKLRQVNFSDGDQFFQQFKELAYYTGIRDNEQVMIAQIKKAAQETSKNTIYSADGEVLTSYKGWKARLLCMDYNWHLKRAGRHNSRTHQLQVTGSKGDHAPEGWSDVKYTREENGGGNDIRRAWSTNGYRRSKGSSKVFSMWQDWPLQT